MQLPQDLKEVVEEIDQNHIKISKALFLRFFNDRKALEKALKMKAVDAHAYLYLFRVDEINGETVKQAKLILSVIKEVNQDAKMILLDQNTQLEEVKESALNAIGLKRIVETKKSEKRTRTPKSKAKKKGRTPRKKN